MRGRSAEVMPLPIAPRKDKQCHVVLCLIHVINLPADSKRSDAIGRENQPRDTAVAVRACPQIRTSCWLPLHLELPSRVAFCRTAPSQHSRHHITTLAHHCSLPVSQCLRGGSSSARPRASSTDRNALVRCCQSAMRSPQSRPPSLVRTTSRLVSDSTRPPADRRRVPWESPVLAQRRSSPRL